MELDCLSVKITVTVLARRYCVPGPTCPGLAEPTDSSFNLMHEAVLACLKTKSRENKVRMNVTAGWSLVHGFAELWLNGPLRNVISREDIEENAEKITSKYARIIG